MPVQLTRAEYLHRVAAIASFREEHGRDPGVTDHVDGLALGSWLARQRTNRRAGKLDDWQVEALDRARIDWAPKRGPIDAKPGQRHAVGKGGWVFRFRQAVLWMRQHGHPPSQHDRLPDGYTIGRWLAKQRDAFRAGELDDRQVHALQKAGLLATMPERGSAHGRHATERWRAGFQALLAYRAEHGHADPPSRYVTPDGYQLGIWLKNQRGAHRRGKLNPERVKALSEAGVTWALPTGYTHRGYVDRLVAFHRAHGHIQVPLEFQDADGAPLGRWLADRRAEKDAGTLAPDLATEIDLRDRSDARVADALKGTAARMGVPVRELLDSVGRKASAPSKRTA